MDQNFDPAQKPAQDMPQQPVNENLQQPPMQQPPMQQAQVPQQAPMQQAQMPQQQAPQMGYQASMQQTAVYLQQQNQSNGMGTTGFVFALLAFFLGWVPFLGWILWILGVVFSFIGVFKVPRGLAVAGLIISFLGLIIILFLAGIVAAAIGMS